MKIENAFNPSLDEVEEMWGFQIPQEILIQNKTERIVSCTKITEDLGKELLTIAFSNNQRNCGLKQKKYVVSNNRVFRTND